MPTVRYTCVHHTSAQIAPLEAKVTNLHLRELPAHVQLPITGDSDVEQDTVHGYHLQGSVDAESPLPVCLRQQLVSAAPHMLSQRIFLRCFLATQ